MKTEGAALIVLGTIVLVIVVASALSAQANWQAPLTLLGMALYCLVGVVSLGTGAYLFRQD